MELASRISGFVEEEKALAYERSALIETRRGLKVEIDTLKATSQKLQFANKSLLGEVKSLKDQIRSLHESKRVVEEERDQLAASETSLLFNNGVKAVEIQKLGDELKTTQDSCARYMGLIEQLEKCDTESRTKTKILKGQIGQLKTELKRKDSVYVTVNRHLKSMEQDNADYQTNNRNTCQRLRGLIAMHDMPVQPNAEIEVLQNINSISTYISDGNKRRRMTEDQMVSEGTNLRQSIEALKQQTKDLIPRKHLWEALNACEKYRDAYHKLAPACSRLKIWSPTPEQEENARQWLERVSHGKPGSNTIMTQF